MNDDYILQDILDRLRTTFGIESPLSNGSERLSVLVSLLGIYDSNWSLESFPVRIGYHVDEHNEHNEPNEPNLNILSKEDCNTLKRWLQRLDLGYLVGSKKIEDFCALKKKYHHLISVLMDKIEQHHGITKLKSNIRVIIQKQSRMKVRSSSLNLTKRKVASYSSSYDGSAVDEKSFEEIFHGTQIPRTPAKPLSPSNPNAEEQDTNKTYDIANELSITPLTFVKDFEDLPYDNSNKRSSHYRRSSFDKNIIPTGRQIPNTPTHHSKSPSDSINATYTIADQSKDTDKSEDAQFPIEQQPPTSSKRRRSLSRDRITNYALDEPESGTIWDDECDEADFHIRMKVKDINWESTFSSDKTFGGKVSDEKNESVENEAPEKDLNNSFKKLNLNSEEQDIKTKPSRTRRKKVADEKKSEGAIEDPNNCLAKTSRVSRRKKTPLESTKECSAGTKDLSDVKEEPKKPRSRTKKGSKVSIPDNNEATDQISTLPDEEKSIRKVKKGPKLNKLSDKENSDPISDESKNRSALKDYSSSVCGHVEMEGESEEGRVLRRSTRTRKTNVKYTEPIILNDVIEENTNDSTSETKKRATRRKKTTKPIVQDEVSIFNDPPKKRGSRKKAEASQV